ncbi:hypothetical protein C8F01DRAFT_1140000 [Mycena amicta]|nr:hypothetical protein C8F01DRAFT_1140000 [Mycena amicta]
MERNPERDIRRACDDCEHQRAADFISRTPTKSAINPSEGYRLSRFSGPAAIRAEGMESRVEQEKQQRQEQRLAPVAHSKSHSMTASAHGYPIDTTTTGCWRLKGTLSSSPSPSVISIHRRSPAGRHLLPTPLVPSHMDNPPSVLASSAE